jgi:hypothetical protein
MRYQAHSRRADWQASSGSAPDGHDGECLSAEVLLLDVHTAALDPGGHAALATKPADSHHDWRLRGEHPAHSRTGAAINPATRTTNVSKALEEARPEPTEQLGTRPGKALNSTHSAGTVQEHPTPQSARPARRGEHRRHSGDRVRHRILPRRAGRPLSNLPGGIDNQHIAVTTPQVIPHHPRHALAIAEAPSAGLRADIHERESVCGGVELVLPRRERGTIGERQWAPAWPRLGEPE